MGGEIKNHMHWVLDLPPGYRELNSGEPLLDSDVEGDPRGFSGWAQVRPEIRGKPFCKCWGIMVLRAI